MDFAWGRLLYCEILPLQHHGGLKRDERGQVPLHKGLGREHRTPATQGTWLWFWQVPSEIYRLWGFICRVANIWQNSLLEASQPFLLLAQISPHREWIWHGWCEHFDFKMDYAINSIKGGSTADQTHLPRSICVPESVGKPIAFLLSLFSFTPSINPVYQALVHKGKSAAH